MPQTLAELVRRWHAPPFVRELERLQRIEEAARLFIDRWDTDQHEAITDAIADLRRAVRS